MFGIPCAPRKAEAAWACSTRCLFGNRVGKKRVCPAGSSNTASGGGIKHAAPVSGCSATRRWPGCCCMHIVPITHARVAYSISPLHQHDPCMCMSVERVFCDNPYFRVRVKGNIRPSPAGPEGRGGGRGEGQSTCAQRPRHAPGTHAHMRASQPAGGCRGHCPKKRRTTRMQTQADGSSSITGCTAAGSAGPSRLRSPLLSPSRRRGRKSRTKSPTRRCRAASWR